jgi:hypothetical protein
MNLAGDPDWKRLVWEGPSHRLKNNIKNIIKRNGCGWTDDNQYRDK